MPSKAISFSTFYFSFLWCYIPFFWISFYVSVPGKFLDVLVKLLKELYSCLPASQGSVYLWRELLLETTVRQKRCLVGAVDSWKVFRLWHKSVYHDTLYVSLLFNFVVYSWFSFCLAFFNIFVQDKSVSITSGYIWV